jgi:hypothetical protein
MRNTYKIGMKIWKERLIGRPVSRWMDDINVDIRVIGSGSLNCFSRRFSENIERKATLKTCK